MATKGGPVPKTREDDRRGGGAPGVRGNPGFEVRDGEREKVTELARVCTARQIGLILRGPAEPIAKGTILAHFADELAFGRANMVSDAGGKLVDAVLAGKESSIHFYLRTQGDPGQFVERRELTGAGGGPIATFDVAAAMEKLAGMNDEDLPDLERIASILGRLAGERPDGPATALDQAGPDSEGNSSPPA
jgi:hypothetical protein